MKLRVFKGYVESIFLYNSELWTLTRKLENTIDTFQRRQLRKILNIHWPEIISNKQLYERTKQDPWTTTIHKRRFSWFGHLLRLPKTTPARKALQKFVEPAKKPVGRPKTTWLSTILSDIKKYSSINLVNDDVVNLDILEKLCSDRKVWKKTVGSIMLLYLTNVH